MSDAQQHSSPVHSQGLILGAVVIGILLMAVYLTSSIVESENGGISAAVRTIGIGLAIWSLVRPKAGLYIISIEAFTLDYVKKLAVYYGTVSMSTVIEVLVVGMLAVVGTIGGVLIQSVALRRYKLTPFQWGVMGIAALATSAVFLASERTLGLEKAGENAFNACVYIAIALPMSVMLADREQVSKILNVQYFLATTWAFWGIKQYYYGFDLMEWFYAETGLSSAASAHMITIGDVRPFGFGTGVANYSVLAAYFSYGVWRILQQRHQRILSMLCTAILFWGVVTSLQRTTLLMPILTLVFYVCLQNMRRSFAVYGVGTVLFLLGVTFAEEILARFNDINDLISFKGSWAENVLTVNTYSARLMSWMNLKDWSNYSFFGVNKMVDSHDIFTKIIVSYGVVGLLVALTILIWVAWFVQRTVLRVEDPTDRKFAIFCLSVTLPTIAVGFIGDGNFTANPVNVQLWTFFGAAVCMVVNSRLAPVDSKQPVRILEELLQNHGPKIPLAAQAAMLRSKA